MPTKKKTVRKKSAESRPLADAALAAEVAALREQLSSLLSAVAAPDKKRRRRKGAAKPPKPPVAAWPSTAESEAPVYELQAVRPAKSGFTARPTGSPGQPEQALQFGLLELAKQHWIEGDWHALARLEMQQIGHHPERAPLALLVSIGLCRTGSLARARRLLGSALQWGCEPETVCRLLWASVHRNLAVAYALNRREQQARKHLELASLAAGEAGWALKESCFHALALPTPMTLPVPGRGASAGALSPNSVIVVAGMRHAGSTALFNILRLGLSRAGHEFVSCYSEHENCPSKVRQSGSMGLIKTHEFRDDLLGMADLVFTARRDLRDTVASAHRRGFSLYLRLKTAGEYAKYNRALYELWAPRSDFEFVYEKFMEQPVSVVGDVLEMIGVSRALAAEIYRQLLDLPTDDYQNTLLSPTHITDPTHRLSYSDTLAPADIMTIQAHHYDWLQCHGYALPSDTLTPP